MGKHNLGLFYFKKALQENDNTCAQLGDGGNGQGKRNENSYLPLHKISYVEKKHFAALLN